MALVPRRETSNLFFNNDSLRGRLIAYRTLCLSARGLVWFKKGSGTFAGTARRVHKGT